MKKILYPMLLIAELVADFLLMSLAWANTFKFASVIIVIISAVLELWQIILYIRTKDSVARRKIKRNIALFMLIPVVGFIILLIWFMIGLSLVI